MKKKHSKPTSSDNNKSSTQNEHMKRTESKQPVKQGQTSYADIVNKSLLTLPQKRATSKDHLKSKSSGSERKTTKTTTIEMTPKNEVID